MKTSLPVVSNPRIAAITSVAIATLALGHVLHAQDVFTGGAGASPILGGDAGAYDFSNGSNWSNGTPNLQTSGSAQIDSAGVTVDYYAGTYGDFVISNGGVLELTAGTFDQVTGNNWIQLQGNATILVNGGTFEQGSDSNNPFNCSNGNDLFEITSGAAVFDNPVHVAGSGQVSWDQTGGNVTSSGEFDFNGPGSSMSGGVLNVPLMTGVNGSGHSEFDFSGGVINLSTDDDGIYNGGTAWNGTTGWDLNFTLGSTGELVFASGDTLSTVQAFVTDGQIQYNNTIDTTGTTDFIVAQQGNGTITVQLVGSSVPEPQTWAMFFGGIAGLACFRRARKARK